MIRVRNRLYRICFIIEQVLGHVTYGKNLQKYVPDDPEIEAYWALPAWDKTSSFRKMPIYKSNWTVQAGIQAHNSIAAIHRETKLDGLFFHTQVTAVLAQDWMKRIPGVISLDATPVQYDALGEFYDHSKGSDWLEGLKWKMNRDCFQKAKKLVAWSDWVKKSLIQDYAVPPEKIVVIPPGVDTRAWADSRIQKDGKEALKILFVGGNLQRKGGLLLLDAFRQIRKEWDKTGIELHLVTKDHLPEEPGVFIYNQMEPNSRALKELYHASDIFCLPTYGDCLPMVLSEAGAAGLPTISTQVAAIPEIVMDGKTGILIPAGDASALAGALRTLIENPDLRHRFGAQAQRSVAESFDAAINARKLLSLLKETIPESQMKVVHE
jgi:glycosyltransferase involved in cell wall biosynthesis